MVVRKPLVLDDQNEIAQLPSGDTVSGASAPAATDIRDALDTLFAQQEWREVHRDTNLSGLISSTQVQIQSSTGLSVTLTSAATGTAGIMTGALFDKLDGIEAGATADQTGAEIKSAYEAEADTNAFTDAEKTKLTGIETDATADQTGAEIKSAYEAEADTNAFTDDEKTKLAGLESSKYLGTYANLTALETAHATPEIGSYGHVDAGVGNDVEVYIWDNDDSAYVLMGSGGSETGASIKIKYEGEADTNAYTDAAKAKVDFLTVTGAVNVDTVASNAANGQTAFGWGDHSGQGYLTSVAWGDVTGKPTTFTPATHTHTKSDITDFVETDYATGAEGDLATTAHGWGDHSVAGYITGYTVTQGDVTAHEAALSITESQISDLQAYLTSVSWADVTSKPAQVSAGEITAGTETAIRMYSPADVVSLIDTHAAGGGGGDVSVEDDGTEIVAAATTLNFTGAGVTVTDVSGVATIAIPGGGSSGGGGGDVKSFTLPTQVGWTQEGTFTTQTVLSPGWSFNSKGWGVLRNSNGTDATTVMMKHPDGVPAGTDWTRVIRCTIFTSNETFNACGIWIGRASNDKKIGFGIFHNNLWIKQRYTGNTYNNETTGQDQLDHFLTRDMYLRILRSGDTLKMSASFDGFVWIECTEFDEDVGSGSHLDGDCDEIGVYVAVASGTVNDPAMVVVKGWDTA